MHSPVTVKASVSQDVIAKVTRLFNGSLADILNELFQNARRAGATRIGVTNGQHGEQHWIEISDNGGGIADPSHLLALGVSGWDAGIAAREDPAGMGLFALAGRKTRITSFHGSDGFSLVVPADGWTGRKTLRVKKVFKGRGTRIRFEASAPWARDLRETVAKAARYLPLTVEHSGQQMESVDFLEGAVLIEEILGVRIGVYAKTHHGYEPSINFHGVTINRCLPRIAEDGSTGWSVKLDVVSAPDLQLVLPARKEVVETTFLAELMRACKCAIFRAIAQRGEHRLAYADWREAQALGIMLPQARALLPPWCAPTAEDGLVLQDRCVPGAGALLVAEMPVIEAQLLERAFQMDNALKHTLICANTAYIGYTWYDSLPCITRCNITATHGDASVRHDALGKALAGDHRIDDASITLDIASPAGLTNMIVPLDVVIGFQDENFSQLSDAMILVTRASMIVPEDLSDLLFNALFEYWQDCDADSYESQSRDFREEALHRAYQLLRSREAADLLRIENAMRTHILWMVPRGQQLSARISDTHCVVSVSDDEHPVLGHEPAR